MTKTKFKWFSIFQYEAEQEYLRNMHSAGWKLIGISFPGFYHFEECTPEDVVYQLDYQNGISHKREYVQIFADCGWEYMFDFVGYSYFRKPVSQMENQEKIFCDDESGLDMMKRVFKGRATPLLCIFFGIILPQLFLQTSLFHRNTANQVTAALYLVLFAMYVTLFVSFGIQFFSYRKRTAKPGVSNKVKYGGFLLVTLVLCAFAVFSAIHLIKPVNSKYQLNTTPGQYSIGAEYLNGTIQHEMELKAGDELEVTLQVVKGDIHLRIYLDDKNPICDRIVSDFTAFSLPIPASGTYTIITDGEDAEGSFSFHAKD